MATKTWTVIGLLEAHGIQCDVDDEGTTWVMEEHTRDGRYYAEWIDATDWTVKDAADWLGL